MSKQKVKEHKVVEMRGRGIFATDKWHPLIIFVFSFVLYFNTIFNSYNLDDELVTQNHHLTSKGISAIPEIFASPYYQDAKYKYEYRPIVLVSFAIEHTFFGDNPHISHLINILLYSLLCLLLFFTLRKLFAKYSSAFPFLVALIFAAHPIHTEVVASIKNRDEIFALLFGLSSLFFALQWVAERKILKLLLVPVFFLIGIWSKSTMLTFVLLIPMSLIFFTNVSFYQLLVTTTLLAFPAVVFSRLYSVSQQIMFIALLYLIVSLLFFFKKGIAVQVNVIEYIKDKYLLLKARAEPDIKIDYQLNFAFLKSPLLFFSTALLVLVPVLISILGFYGNSGIAACLPVFLLAIIYLLVRDEIKLILITPISLLVLIAVVRFGSSPTLFESAFFVFLAMQILSSAKQFQIVGAINLGAYAMASVFLLHSYFFIAIFFFAGFLNKKLFPITVVIVLLSLFSFGKNLYEILNHSKAFKIAFLSLPLIYSSVFLLRKNKQYLLVRSSVVAIPLALSLYFILLPPGQNNTLTTRILSGYYQLNKTQAADFTPVQAARPLRFIEYPIEKTDGFDIKIGTSMVVLAKYLKLIILPYPMSYYYGYAYISPISIKTFIPLLSFIIYCALFILGILLVRKYTIFSYAILFYLISIVVFSNLIIPVPGMIGDRFLFIPSIGFSVFVIALFLKLFKQKTESREINLMKLSAPSKICLTLLLCIYALVTVARNADWKDRVTLFKHDISVVENSAQAQNLLAVHLLIQSREETDAVKQGKIREDAIIHFKKAIEIYPQFLNATYDLGRTYDAMGQYDEAIRLYKQTLLIDSTFALPRYRLGIILHNKGNLNEAIVNYEKYLISYPAAKDIYANLSYAYFQIKNYDKAIEVGRRTLQNTDSPFEPLVNISKIYLEMRNTDSAAYYYEQAYLLNPNDNNVLKRLTDIYMQTNNTEKINFYKSKLKGNTSN